MSTLEVSSDKQGLLGNDKKPKRNNGCLKIGLIIAVIIIVVLGVLNVYQAGMFDGNNNNSNSNDNNELTSCIHGEYYLDRNEPSCECYSCFTGDNCEIMLDDCVISAGGGSAHMFVEYWNIVADAVEEVTIPINYRAAYQSNLFGPFSETQSTGIGGELNQLIRSVHKKFNNVNTTGKYLIMGVGASQLTTAFYTAWGKIKGTQIIAYARNPYYYLLQTRCRAATSMYCTWNASNELGNEVDKIVEMVTIPNNPDGKEYEPWYDSDAIGHDLVYYWPHFYEAEDIYNLAMTMRTYMSESVLALPIDTHIRAKQIFGYLASDNGANYFDYVRERMRSRWATFLSIFEGQSNYIQRGEPLKQYGWMECVNKTNSECRAKFNEYQINPRSGADQGCSNCFRFNLAEYEGNFPRIMERFKNMVDAER